MGMVNATDRSWQCQLEENVVLLGHKFHRLGEEERLKHKLDKATNAWFADANVCRSRNDSLRTTGQYCDMWDRKLVVVAGYDEKNQRVEVVRMRRPVYVMCWLCFCRTVVGRRWPMDDRPRHAGAGCCRGSSAVHVHEAAWCSVGRVGSQRCIARCHGQGLDVPSTSNE